MIEQRGYQRTYLRAPYKEPILYIDDNFVFKASTLNLSVGGILLDQIPHFPEENEVVPLLISLPQYPYFKNFTLEKLRNFSAEIFPKKVIRLKGHMVRKIGVESKTDEVFTSRIGIKFVEVSAQNQKLIQDYVNIFSSNLIYLQMLIDNINTSDKHLKKIRALCRILSYDEQIKIAALYKQVQHDYLSLQWL
jgi:hypothetical protein